MTYSEQSGIYGADTPSIGAFGALKVVQDVTIGEGKQIVDNLPLFWDDQQVSGSGTSSTHSVNRASTKIAVSNATAGVRIRQTFRRYNYQPGKGQVALMTFIMDAASAGDTFELGYFDDQNGLFLRRAGSTLSVVVRSYVTGAAVETDIPQSSWNEDKFDGTGRSGITIDPTKINIFAFDFEWLGGGRVRFGFNIGGITIIAHEQVYANQINSVYMSTPNLPFRYRIANNGTGGARFLECICTSISTEGGQQDSGLVRFVSNETTPVTCGSVGTWYALLGIRLKSTHLGITIKTLKAALCATTSADLFTWQLRWNPTVATTVPAPFSYTDVTNSALQLAVGLTANTVTGGTILNGGYGASGIATSDDLTNALILGASIAGVSDTLVLCASPLSTSTGITAGLTVRELL